MSRTFNSGIFEVTFIEVHYFSTWRQTRTAAALTATKADLSNQSADLTNQELFDCKALAPLAHAISCGTGQLHDNAQLHEITASQLKQVFLSAPPCWHRPSIGCNAKSAPALSNRGYKNSSSLSTDHYPSIIAHHLIPPDEAAAFRHFKWVLRVELV